MIIFKNDKSKEWYIVDHGSNFDENILYESAIYKAKFGEVTYQIFNILNKISNSKILPPNIHEEYKQFVLYCVANKDFLLQDFKDLENAMLNKRRESNLEKFTYFKNFASLPESIFRKEYSKNFYKKDRESINWNKSCEHLGFYFFPSFDEVLDVYVCLDISSLFILDFKEYLFRMDRPEIVKCDYCKDYFICKTKKQILCYDCGHNTEIKNKRDYQRRRNNECFSEINRIQNMLRRRSNRSGDNSLLDEFNAKVEYFKKKLESKVQDFELRPDLENIPMDSDKDLLHWLHEEHERLKKRKNNI